MKKNYGTSTELELWMKSLVFRNKIAVKRIFHWMWKKNPNNKDHGANMGPTWVLLAPGGPHVGPMNLAIKSIVKRARDLSWPTSRACDITCE